MPRKSYSPKERDAIRFALIEEANRLFAQYGIAHTNLCTIYENIGISRAFFYRFFDSKTALAKAVLLTLFPRIMTIFRRILHAPNDRDFKTRMEQFLWLISDPTLSGCAIPTPEEQTALLQSMTSDEKHVFDQQRRGFAADMMAEFHLTQEHIREEAFLNCLMTILMMRLHPFVCSPLCFQKDAENAFSLAVTAFIFDLTRRGAHL